MVSLTAPVSQSLSPRGPCSIAQCHHHHTVLHAWHSAAAQPCGVTAPWCHTVSLSLHAARGVTVAAWPWGATQCHRGSHGLSHGVTVTAWCMGCHTAPCHCMAHGCHPASRHRSPAAHRTTLPSARGLRVSPSILSLHGLWGVTQCHSAVPRPLPCTSCRPSPLLLHGPQPTGGCIPVVPNALGNVSPWSRAGPICPPHPCPLLPGKQ